eukprot:m51a1_g5200 hypothetical protein (113) ;mRNA; f:213218-213702
MAAAGVIGIRFGIPADGAMGDLHIYGTIAPFVLATIEKFAAERKAEGSKTQVLRSKDDEALVTKLEVADYFRLEVRLVRELAANGWHHVSTEQTPSKSLKTTIHIWAQQAGN